MADRPVCVTMFVPRRFPEVVVVDEQSIVGPFCQNCGFAETFHVRVTHKRTKESVLGCPPPNGLNPMDPRCPRCTLKAMRMTLGLSRHKGSQCAATPEERQEAARWPWWS